MFSGKRRKKTGHHPLEFCNSWPPRTCISTRVSLLIYISISEVSELRTIIFSESTMMGPTCPNTHKLWYEHKRAVKEIDHVDFDWN